MTGIHREILLAIGVFWFLGAVNEVLADTTAGEQSVGLQEIIVTAQKRAENIQDVPVPVTAINAEELVEAGQLRLQDYLASAPGVTLTAGGFNASPSLTIRGISSLGGNNTVGIMIDGVPFGPSTPISQGSDAPDIDPGDLARVEVLRGPQGTLYGASSIGGLVNFITVDPSLDRVSGHVQAGASTTYGASGAGYNVRGSVNIPLSDTIALRGSAFTNEDPGYIDNPVLNLRDLNKQTAYGGRLAVLWKPSDDISLTVSALLQRSKLAGSPEVDMQTGLGDLQQDRIPNTGWFDKTIQAYSATFKAKLGSVDFTSLTGYNVSKWSGAYDFTQYTGFAAQDLFGVSGSPLDNDSQSDSFSQEVRFSSSIGAHFEWLLGGFYNYVDTSYVQMYPAENATTGEIVGTMINSDSFPTTYTETAGFLDLTYHFTDEFDVQLGGRESANRQTYHETVTGIGTQLLYGMSSPVVIPKTWSNDNSFTYLVTPRFRLSPDLMIYARFASGYRPGGPNPSYSLYDLPPSFQPDKTHNYELGVKGDVLNHSISFDGSVYYVDWKNLQVYFVNPTNGVGYLTNAGDAKSQGLELSVDVRPIDGLTLSAWSVWNEAVLKDAFPPTSQDYGLAGEQLPLVSRFSGNVAARDEFPLISHVTGAVGISFLYVGNRPGVFTSTPERQDFGGYGKLDLTASATYETWTVGLYGNNITDRRGALSGGLGTLNPPAFYYIQPRTLGVNFRKSF